MDILLGLLAAVVFFIWSCAVLYFGYKIGSKQTTAESPDDEAKRKAEEMQKAFQSMMNYDLSTAMRRKKVG